MNPILQKLLGDAARLTRSGDLHGAVAAIQHALGKTGPHPGHAAPPRTTTQAQADIIDILAREVPNEAARATAPSGRTQPSSPQGGTDCFLPGRHSGLQGARDYKLYVPPGYTGQPLPLVVMLHGCTQDPDDFAAGTGMNEAARQQGFFVLYPAQSQKANPQRCWNWFKHNHQQRGRGEPALLAAMTREVMAEYHIDPQRVYVAGLSAGGAMAAILGETYPELFAAVGVHSGLASGAATDVAGAFAAMKGGAGPARAASGRPTIVFHGDQDNTVHPVNGEHVVAACVVPDAQSPRERARSGNGRDYTRRSHRDANGRVVAEHWLVHGAGHAWSGGHPRGSYTDARGPDATQEMLRFFFANAQPQAH